MLLILLIRPSLQSPRLGQHLNAAGEARRRVSAERIWGRGNGSEPGLQVGVFAALPNSSLSQGLGFREEPAWWDFGVRGKV